MKIARLGIFWIIDEEIFSYSMPLDRAEHVAGYANYPHGHVQLWPLVLRSYPHLRNRTYDQVPRGRITYDKRSDCYRLLMPPRLVRDRPLVRRLVGCFDLPIGKVRVLADEHYRDIAHESGLGDGAQS